MNSGGTITSPASTTVPTRNRLISFRCGRANVTTRRRVRRSILFSRMPRSECRVRHAEGPIIDIVFPFLPVDPPRSAPAGGHQCRELSEPADLCLALEPPLLVERAS